MALVLAMLGSSCTKDWLDVAAESQIRAEDQFNSESGFKDALIGSYIGMTDPALYSKDLTWNMIDLLSQQYNALPAGAQYLDLQQYNYTSVRAQPKIDAVWSHAYNTIANINGALNYIDKKKAVLNPISFSIIKGELLGLRAFLHFDLMRIYGYGNLANRTDLSGKLAIPYVSNFNKDVTPQRSYPETFALMAKDIADALELLKEDPLYPNPSRPAGYYDDVNRNGFFSTREQRMNYYAVRALQARMLLWQGGAENLSAARTAAEDVIAHSPAKLITPSYNAAGDPSLYPENVFCLNVTAFADIVNRYLDASKNTNYDALFMLRPAAETLYETSNTNIGVPDIRFNTLLQAQTLGMVSVKHRQAQSRVNGNIMPLIKIPEMYYIAAEYYISTGDLNKAIAGLNTVRSSRNIIQAIPATTDRSVVESELFKEYRKEFVSEGQLFFYYKRTGRTAFPGLAVTRIADDKLYVLPYPGSELEFGNRVQ